jgi:hypothetical protein
VDTNEVHQRLSFVNALYRWSNNRHDAGVLEAALDAIPPGVDRGWVVVWLYDSTPNRLEPTMAYKAHWTTYRLGILRCLAKARKDMNLAVTIIDVQAVEVCSIVKDGQW